MNGHSESLIWFLLFFTQQKTNQPMNQTRKNTQSNWKFNLFFFSSFHTNYLNNKSMNTIHRKHRLNEKQQNKQTKLWMTKNQQFNFYQKWSNFLLGIFIQPFVTINNTLLHWMRNNLQRNCLILSSLLLTVAKKKKHRGFRDQANCLQR